MSSSRSLVAGASLLALALGAALLAPSTAAAATISFTWSHLKDTNGNEINFSNPTSLQFGPDDRLYVAYQDGTIRVYTVTRQGANDYVETSTETINTIANIPNHNDDGTLNTSVTGRLVTGLAVTGTASNPVIYVSSSDPRFGVLTGETDLDTNSGMISKLTWNGSSWTRTDLVRGLPRSDEVHAPNGLALHNGDLYLAIGGHTNMGSPSSNFGLLKEYALSAAVLQIDLSAITNPPYDLPTLDDASRGAPANPDASHNDVNDPFGGDKGLNQAKLVSGGPVQVYGAGFRNPYDLIWHSNGSLYAMDNGSNANAGGVPVGEGPNGTCTNDVNTSDPGITDHDGLYRITPPNPTTGAIYYQGHPNPTRANRNNTFGGQSPIPAGMENPVECDYQSPGSEDGTVPKDPANDALAVFNFSTNGIAEYTASNFGGAMQGNLLVAQLDSGGTGTVFRMALGGTNGTYVQTKQQLPVTGYGNDPLDVWAQGDSDPMPGTIWVAMNGSDQITILEPGDYGGGGGGTCSAPDDNGDADGDGYTNHDEIVNGTDPCSAGSIPPDNDGDHVSDKLDPDDDNDGITDLNDAFQTDAQNGLSTQLPVSITWNPTDPDPGGILNSGFTGLMTNGSTDYLTTYDPANMTVGSAAGVFTIDNVPTGDALGTINTQKYGFQFGIDPPGQTFTVHTRVNTPFLGVTPTGQDAMGVTIGAGDQDNYVRLVASANGPSTDGVSFLKEVGGTTSNSTIAAVTLPGPDYIDLYLVVNPVADTVQPRYSVTTNCSTSCQTTVVKDLGSPVAIPASWFAGTSKGLAVGIISTSRNGNAFSATWDSIDVTTSGGGGGGSGTWATLAPTGFARQELPYNVVNGRFYLAGGIAPSGDPRRIQVYDPTTDTWEFTGAILPAALNHMRSAVVDGKIYYIGGYLDTTNEEVGTVSIYDPSTNTVTAGTPMPRPRAAGGVAVYQGRIYYAGGATTGTTAADKTARTWFDVYDPATDSWSQLPDMPRKRDHFAAAVVNGKFYALAGRNKRIGSTWSQNAAYDFGTGTWSENVAPTPTPRGGVATAVIGSQILVIGGERSVNGVKSVLNVVEAYDTSTNTWTTLAPMPTARHGMEAVVYNGKVYVADGSSVSGGGPASSLAVHEVYTP